MINEDIDQNGKRAIKLKNNIICILCCSKPTKIYLYG